MAKNTGANAVRDNSKLLSQLRLYHPSLKSVVDGREHVPVIVTATLERQIGKTPAVAPFRLPRNEH